MLIHGQTNLVKFIKSAQNTAKFEYTTKFETFLVNQTSLIKFLEYRTYSNS